VERKRFVGSIYRNIITRSPSRAVSLSRTRGALFSCLEEIERLNEVRITARP